MSLVLYLSIYLIFSFNIFTSHSFSTNPTYNDSLRFSNLILSSFNTLFSPSYVNFILSNWIFNLSYYSIYAWWYTFSYSISTRAYNIFS